ncbi:MAG: hypothetical protein K0R00_3205 [Herbinix sp.]|nr:hypothetical protein [Herbinix sp.]
MANTKDSKKELLMQEIKNIKDEEIIRLIYYFTINIKRKK